ncbi:MAG TPA: hypothetical protein VHN12_08720, partial [Geobacteraceae bacterium]|nr:hypothetical protein [Geobacteraceae bacterium]
MVAVKLIPHLLSWVGIVLVLLRGFPGPRPVVAAMGSAGFVVGVAGAFILFRSFPGEIPFGLIKTALGVSFFLLWGISVAAIYRSTSRDVQLTQEERFANTSLCAGAVALAAGMIAGAVCTCKLPGFDSTAAQLLAFAFLALAAVALAFTVLGVEKLLPPSFKVSKSGMLV